MSTKLALTLSGMAAICSFLIAVTLSLGFTHDLINGTTPNLLAHVKPNPNGGLEITSFRDGQSEAQGLRIGDTIIRSGEVVDLPETRTELRHLVASTREVTVSRDGEVFTVDLSEGLYLLPAIALARSVFLIVLGVLVVSFGRWIPQTFLAAATCLCMTVFGQAAPIGPTETLHQVLIVATVLGFGMFFPVGINFIQSFGKPNRLIAYLAPWTIWPVLASLLYHAYDPSIPHAMNLAVGVMMLASMWAAWELVRVFPQTGGAARAQFNCVLAGSAVVIALIVLVFTAALMAGDFTLAFAVAGLIPLLIPLAILKHDFANIDRAASVTVAYSLVVIALALAFEFILEPLAGTVSGMAGLPETAGQTVLIVVVALAAPKLKELLLPKVERVLSRDMAPS